MLFQINRKRLKQQQQKEQIKSIMGKKERKKEALVKREEKKDTAAKKAAQELKKRWVSYCNEQKHNGKTFSSPSRLPKTSIQ